MVQVNIKTHQRRQIERRREKSRAGVVWMPEDARTGPINSLG